MKKTSSQMMQNMGFLFSMLLFLMFILCSVFTILIGSRVYQNIRTRNNDSFYSGTALGYITNKVRQADAKGCVELRTIDDVSVLVLTSQYDDILYETWIYTKDGSLMELFSEKGSGLSTDDGLLIMDCAPVDFTMEENRGTTLLSITLMDGISSASSRLTLRSSGKGDSAS